MAVVSENQDHQSDTLLLLKAILARPLGQYDKILLRSIFSSLLLVNKILTNHLICDIILSCCSPATIFTFARTCRQACTAVNSYVKRAFDINRILSRFFSDPLAFRSLQAETAMLISGSTALQFFDRSFYPNSDLDLYIPMQFREKTGRWLLTQGYKFTPGKKQDPNFYNAIDDRKVLENKGNYIMRGVAGVFTFYKPSKDDPEVELKVQLIVSVRTPMQIILHFHSTCVMNVISFEKAYSFFPRATFENPRISLICATDGPNQEPAMGKYASRGWEMVHRSPAFKPGKRWVGDGSCWTISLNMEGVVLPPPPFTPHSTALERDPVRASSWTMMCDPDFGGAMDFTCSHSSYLLLRYVTNLDLEDFGMIMMMLRGRYSAMMENESRDKHLLPSNQKQYLDKEFIACFCDYYGVDSIRPRIDYEFSV